MNINSVDGGGVASNTIEYVRIPDEKTIQRNILETQPINKVEYHSFEYDTKHVSSTDAKCEGNIVIAVESTVLPHTIEGELINETNVFLEDLKSDEQKIHSENPLSLKYNADEPSKIESNVIPTLMNDNTQVEQLSSQVTEIIDDSLLESETQVNEKSNLNLENVTSKSQSKKSKKSTAAAKDTLNLNYAVNKKSSLDDNEYESIFQDVTLGLYDTKDESDINLDGNVSSDQFSDGLNPSNETDENKKAVVVSRYATRANIGMFNYLNHLNHSVDSQDDEFNSRKKTRVDPIKYQVDESVIPIPQPLPISPTVESQQYLVWDSVRGSVITDENESITVYEEFLISAYDIIRKLKYRDYTKNDHVDNFFVNGNFTLCRHDSDDVLLKLLHDW